MSAVCFVSNPRDKEPKRIIIQGAERNRGGISCRYKALSKQGQRIISLACYHERRNGRKEWEKEPFIEVLRRIIRKGLGEKGFVAPINKV